MAMSLPGAFWVWGSPPGRQPRPGCRLTPAVCRWGSLTPLPGRCPLDGSASPFTVPGSVFSQLLPSAPPYPKQKPCIDSRLRAVGRRGHGNFQ